MKKSDFRELIRESVVQVLLERKRPITTERALRMAKKMRASNKVDIEQLRKGMEVEQEHLGTIGRFNYLTLARIALDHLKEIPDYYDRLDKMENEAKTRTEISTTAGAPGFMTPKAFTGKKRKRKKS